jgi:hypothetical protein
MVEVLFMALFKVGLAIADKNDDWKARVDQFTTAEGIYYGLRFWGICCMVGLVLG